MIEKYQPLLSLDWNLLFSVITVLVLFVILKHFFFDKVHNFMEAREKEIRDSLENAEKTSQLADEKLKNYEAKIENVQAEGRQIIKAARDEAKNQSNDIIEKANLKARNLLEHSEKEIRRERYNARKELREEVGNLAVMAAEKIMERDLHEEDQVEIVNQVLKEAEDKPWN